MRSMYFSELLTKITLGRQNQQPSEKQMKAGADIMHKAAQHQLDINEREKDIVCRVVNGNKVKKRRYHKEEEKQQESAEK